MPNTRVTAPSGAAPAVVQPPTGVATPPTSGIVLLDGAGNLLRTVDNGDGTATLITGESATAATMPAAVVMQNAATSTGNGTTLTVAGYVVALLSVTASVAMSGGTTITFEASTDNTTWVTIAGHAIGVNGSLSSTTTTTGDYRFAVAGYTSLRARISTYSAGTITIKGYVAPVASQPTVVSPAVPAGTARSVALTGTGTQIVSATPRDIRGIVLRETTGTASAVVQVYDNASAASGTVYPYSLDQSESRDAQYLEGGFPTVNGIVVKVTGTVEGTIILGP